MKGVNEADIYKYRYKILYSFVETYRSSRPFHKTYDVKSNIKNIYYEANYSYE